MSVERLESHYDYLASDESSTGAINNPINGTDARRRLEDKLEEQRLLRELKEFDFDLN